MTFFNSRKAKVFRSIATLAVLFACLFSFGACDWLEGLNPDKKPSPDIPTHFIGEEERDEEAYIPLVELAKEDEGIYEDFESNLESKQLREMYEIIMAGKLPRISENNLKITTGVHRVWQTIQTLFLEFTYNGMTDYDRIHTYHDWLVVFVDYDFDTYEAYLEDPESVSSKDKTFSFYGALQSKVSVCQGIAEAFNILCKLSLIDSYMVTGQMNGINHAWNKVQLEENWYNVDATNDAAAVIIDSQLNKFLTHGYFMISDEAITDTHTAFIDNFHRDAIESYDYYTSKRLYSVGSKNQYARILSKDELVDLFDYIKSKKRNIGKIEVQLDFETETNYVEELRAAYQYIKNSDYSAQSSPWISMPNGVFLLLIYV